MAIVREVSSSVISAGRVQVHKDIMVRYFPSGYADVYQQVSFDNKLFGFAFAH